MKEGAQESVFIRHIPCPACGSKDNNSLYSDGHEFCFGCSRRTAGDGADSGVAHNPRRRKMPLGLIEEVEVRGLRDRQIMDETCTKFGYGYGTYKGQKVHVAPYYDADRHLVAQKIRTKDKDFKVLGDISEALPFGSHVWQPTGKKIVVTEGEIDAMTVSQVQGNKWPVVSISCGAGGQVRKYFAKHAEYFRGFEEVILMFDMDDPGRKAAREAASIIGSRAKIAELPLKDPNEMLKAKKVEELVSAIWRAKAYRPEGIVSLEDLKDAVREKPQYGPSWPWPELTELTYGIQQPYIYTIGAATGAGKSDVLSQIATHLVREHGFNIGMFMLEEEPRTTALNLASKWAGKLLHTPEGWDEETFEDAWKGITERADVYLYDSFGMNDWDMVKDKIEYLHHAHDVRYFFVDHLTAFAAASDDERKALEQIMESVSSLVTKLGITIFLVSHLATPEGKPHEEGGRVMARHYKGSRAVGFWSHGMIGLERNQQDEDPIKRHTTALRILKVRGFGWQVGKCCWVRFDQATGLLNSCEEPTEGNTSADAHGFTDETPAGVGGAKADF